MFVDISRGDFQKIATFNPKVNKQHVNFIRFKEFSRSFSNFPIFKGFSSALENEFSIPGLFKDFKE